MDSTDRHMLSSDVTIVYLAGGHGLRVGGEMPKQFVTIGAYPLWHYAARVFAQCFPQAYWVFVFPQSYLAEAKVACEQLCSSIAPSRRAVVEAGKTRYGSVNNALSAIPLKRQGTLWVHDAARCFLPPSLLKRLHEQALQYPDLGIIPAVSSRDSVRMLTENTYKAIDRKKIFHVQTPQVFPVGMLRDSYARTVENEDFTDDASVVEASGFSLQFAQGDYANIKVTYPEDIELAKQILTS